MGLPTDNELKQCSMFELIQQLVLATNDNLDYGPKWTYALSVELNSRAGRVASRHLKINGRTS